MFKKKTNRHIIHFFIILSLGWSSIGWIDPLADKIREGNSLYQNGKYDEALDKYINVQVNASDAFSKKGTSIPQLDFNIADVQYKRSKYHEAAQLFKKGIESNDIEMRAKSCFNMGNTLYRQGKMKEALEYYKKTVDFVDEASSKDHELQALKNDAKYNYEYVEKKINEQQQQNQEEEDQQQEQKQEEEKEEEKQSEGKEDDKQSEENEGEEDEKKQESQKDKQEQPDQRNSEEENKNSDYPKQPEKDEQKNQPQEQQLQPQDQRQMTKEEAERLLEALNQSEKEARAIMRDTQQMQHRSVDKDW